MAIGNISNDTMQEIIASHFTPSTQVESIERLKGRGDELRQIERALPSKGRHVFIHGDRGVGKTSLAVTSAHLHNSSSHEPIYVLCGEGMTFFEVIQAIANQIIPLADRIERQKQSGTLGFGIPGFASAQLGGAIESTIESPQPRNINDALDVIRYVCSRRDGTSVIVIDEIDRIKDPKQKVLFAEFVKNVPALDCPAKFILCGIGANIEEIIGAHPSAGRYFEPINVRKLNHSALYEIISDAAEVVKIEVPTQMLRRIGIVSDQFPHFVHLIGDCLLWAMFDDPDNVTTASRKHYEIALKGALRKSEPDLELAYRRATEKSKNKVDFEEALWALADKSDTRRQVTEIYSSSYLPLVNKSKDRTPLTKDQFNQRLHNLRKDTHGSVVLNHLAGWFSFRENVFRGYVRLVAEAQGIELRSDPV